MDISTITKKIINEISDEIKKDDNINTIKDDILKILYLYNLYARIF